jgi:hypothetical protein
VAVFNNTIVAAALGIIVTGGEAGHPRLLEHNLFFANPAIDGELGGENFVGDHERAPAAFARLQEDLAQLDLTPSEAVPAPHGSIGDEWLGLPGAREDFLGRPRAGLVFGACRRGGAGEPACR